MIERDVYAALDIQNRPWKREIKSEVQMKVVFVKYIHGFIISIEKSQK